MSLLKRRAYLLNSPAHKVKRAAVKNWKQNRPAPC